MFRRRFLSGTVALLLTAGFSTSGMAMSDTPLHNAAARNDAMGVERLLAERAEVDARNASGATALLAATHANAVKAAKVLIDAGADVNAKDNIQDSP